MPGQDALRFRIYAALSEAYAAWDSFDLPGAERMLDILLATGPADVSEAMRQHLIAQAESLRTINAIGRHLHGRSGPPLAALEDSSFILALFGSLYANAMRREEQGRLDVAALLLFFFPSSSLPKSPPTLPMLSPTSWNAPNWPVPS